MSSFHTNPSYLWFQSDCVLNYLLVAAASFKPWGLELDFKGGGGQGVGQSSGGRGRKRPPPKTTTEPSTVSRATLIFFFFFIHVHVYKSCVLWTEVHQFKSTHWRRAVMKQWYVRVKHRFNCKITLLKCFICINFCISLRTIQMILYSYI